MKQKQIIAFCVVALLCAGSMHAKKANIIVPAAPPKLAAPQQPVVEQKTAAAPAIYPMPTYDYYLKHGVANLLPLAAVFVLAPVCIDYLGDHCLPCFKQEVTREHPGTFEPPAASWALFAALLASTYYFTPNLVDKHLFKEQTPYTTKETLLRMIPFQIGNSIVQKQRHAASLAAAHAATKK